MASSGIAVKAERAPADIRIWDDDTINLTGTTVRPDVPELPRIEKEMQTVKGNRAENLAYLVLQIQKSTDKEVIIRALASAVACLFQSGLNFTGATTEPVALTGLALGPDEAAEEGKVLVTNFQDAEPVTVGELLTVMEADTDEIGAYLGVLFMAGNKKATNENREAFNAKRRNAATAGVIGDPKIFVADSPYLADRVLHKLYASFYAYQPVRANLTMNVVRALNPNLMGPALSFASMFLLLADYGMNALRIIKEASIKHPWLRDRFPELKPEFAAAHKAQEIIRRLPRQERPFAKAIYGNMFVPVSYGHIDNLTGVCKEILRRSTPSYANYRGGKITPSQELIINEVMGIEDAPQTAVSAE